MKPGPGWYVDLMDKRMEKYWNGSMWQDGLRPVQEGTPEFGQGRPLVDEDEVRDHDEYIEQLLEHLLVEQRRSARYLAILACIAVVTVVLGVLLGVVGVLAANN
jgi:hypothetical protein